MRWKVLPVKVPWGSGSGYWGDLFVPPLLSLLTAMVSCWLAGLAGRGRLVLILFLRDFVDDNLWEPSEAYGAHVSCFMLAVSLLTAEHGAASSSSSAMAEKMSRPEMLTT